MQQLKPSSGSSYCEWKGSASYYDAPGKPKVAWYYAKPSSSFEPIANYVCFYPSKVDKATVGEETVTAQPGNFPGSILMLMRSVSAFSNSSTSQLCNVCGHCALHLNKVVGLCRYPNALEQTVRVSAGDFYGGWITSKLVGPFKGSPGTMGW